MKGTERDARWARAIRKRMISELEERAREFEISGLKEKASRIKLWLERMNDARWFIQYRHLGTRTLIRMLRV